jgi:hypothetical protein
MKFLELSIQISAMTFPKRYFASKSTNKWLRYHQKNVEKRLFFVQIEFKKSVKNFDFIRFSPVFQPSFGDISAICWSILMQNSVLERLLVVDYMTEI